VTPLSELKSAAVVGATGLVGRECLSLLAALPAFASVTALVRRPHADDAQHVKLRTVVVDFDHLEAQAEHFGVTHLFCARGARREFRLTERLAASMSWALPATYRAVDVVDVAQTLVDAAIEDRPGIRVIENANIRRLAKEV